MIVSAQLSRLFMAGLVPAIHAETSHHSPREIGIGSAWMPDTRPGMTPLGAT